MSLYSSGTEFFESDYQSRTSRILQFLHIDPVLLFGLLLLMAAGLGIMYSASDGSIDVVQRQLVRLAIAFAVMFLVAQIPQQQLYLWAPWIFAVGIILLVLVLVAGDVGKGAQRWLNLYVIRFQPSEMMKLVTPMMLAWYLCEKPSPPRVPTSRGSESSASASSRDTVAGSIPSSSDARRGLAFFGASSPSTSVTYGPYRPTFTSTGRPEPGSTPRARSPDCLVEISSRARSRVSSSGGRSGGTSPRCPSASST